MAILFCEKGFNYLKTTKIMGYLMDEQIKLTIFPLNLN